MWWSILILSMLKNKTLPNRKNIVISSKINEEYLNKYNNLSYESSFENTLSKLLFEKQKQIFIIGGDSNYLRADRYIFSA